MSKICKEILCMAMRINPGPDLSALPYISLFEIRQL